MAVYITYFVHSTTTDNEAGIATGWLPGELSKKGIGQAKELAKVVAERPFDAVFCSDLKRAVDAAEIVFGDRLAPIQDARLRECNYGDLNGTAADAFKDRLEEYIDRPFPNGESYREVESRLASFLEALGRDYEGKQVAIMAHQAPQLALDVLLKGRTWEEAIAEDWRHTKSWQPGWEYLVP